MLHAVRHIAAAFIATAALIALATLPAQAGTIPPQVNGVATSTQSWANRTVLLTWRAIAGATYTAKYSPSPTLSGATYKTVTSASSNLTGIQPGRTYYAVVRAVKNGQAGPYSARVSLSLKAGYTGLFSSVIARPASNGVTVEWGAAPYATDYRLVSSGGPNPNRRPDHWVPTIGSWFSAFNPVSKTRVIAGTDAALTKTPYGNPIYAHVEARSTIKPSTNNRSSGQVVAWPIPASPQDSALRVHFGSYNVECSGCEKAGTPGWTTRAPVLAENIATRDLDVVTVVEASGHSDSNRSDPYEQAWVDLDRRLAALTVTDTSPLPNPSDQGNRIFYNPDRFTLVATGNLGGIYDYRQEDWSGHFINTPWAKLRSKSDPGTVFLVVAAHYGIPRTTDPVARKTQLGIDSARLLGALDTLNTTHLPVILGGDLNDSRYPEGRTDGAQPTLVRGGFYDSSASLRRNGTTRSTFNNSVAPTSQRADPNGDGQRIDYILTQGFQGSDSFTNNWDPRSPGGSPLPLVPSDHNLIEAILHVPTVSGP